MNWSPAFPALEVRIIDVKGNVLRSFCCTDGDNVNALYDAVKRLVNQQSDFVRDLHPVGTSHD